MEEAKRESVAIVWLQRDLRLHDHPALQAALAHAHRVVLTYIWAREEEGQFQPGRASRWWLHNSLRALEERVEASGGYICYRAGPSTAELLIDVCAEAGARSVFFNNVYDPLSLVRDRELKQRLRAAGIAARAFNGELLYEPWEVLDDAGRPFTDFASFWHKVAHSMARRPAAPNYSEPTHLPTVRTDALCKLRLEDLGLEHAAEVTGNAHMGLQWCPGTAGGLRLLVDFLQNRLHRFSRERAKIDRDSTSRLSAHIHFGEISINVIYAEAIARTSVDAPGRPDGEAIAAFIQQVGYREYSRYLSYHFPFTHECSLLEHVRAVPWVTCPMRFKAWRQGQTGYPLVDAAMRQLWATGWLHNRARVVTASFLVKHLLLPWQWGLKHFWDMLVDADLECDALGWQYVAGCLRDARPFHEMLDLRSEAKRFDPDGAFVRRWVPELAALRTDFIHEPWQAPSDVLAAAGVRLGEEYPFPVVSLAESQAALARASGIVQRCTVQRSLQTSEPYRAPTVPVEIKLLEPEEEVEQAIAVAGILPGTAHRPRHHLARAAPPALPVNGGAAERHTARTAAAGTRLNGELFAPSCVLPDLSGVIAAGRGTLLDTRSGVSVASCGPDTGTLTAVPGSGASYLRSAEHERGLCAGMSDAQRGGDSSSLTFSGPVSFGGRTDAAAHGLHPAASRGLQGSGKAPAAAGAAPEQEHCSQSADCDAPRAFSLWSQLRPTGWPSNSAASSSVVHGPASSGVGELDGEPR